MSTFYEKTRGFTITEILVVIAILGFITLAVSNYQVKIIEYSTSARDSLQSAQDARSILRVMVQELRSAQPGNNGAYPVIQAATSSITFFTDIDDDGLREQIRYFVSTTTLKKGVIVPSGSPLTYNPAQEKISYLAYNIKNGSSTPMFEYFDNTYAGTSSPLTQPVTVSNVRLVKITLLIDADPNRSPVARSYTSEAMLRNLKDNL